jgi:hypothetical protein
MTRLRECDRCGMVGMCGYCCYCGVRLDDVCGYATCPAHTRVYPPALLKAANDPFVYAERLRSGETMLFNYVCLFGDWVILMPGSERGFGADFSRYNSGEDGPIGRPLPFLCPRGVEVHLRDIVWVADAPYGS